MRQKVFLVGAVAISAFAGLVAYPVLARQYSVDAFAGITILFFLNGLFGVIDLLRPAIVYELSTRNDQGRIAIRPFLWPASLLGAGAFLLLFGFLRQILAHQFSAGEALLVAFTGLLFMLYSTLWAAFEHSVRVGSAAAIRAFGFVLFVILLTAAPVVSLPLSPATSFLISHLIVALSFATLGRSLVRFAGPHSRLSKRFLLNALSTFPQNAGKLVIDFADRVFVSGRAAASVVAAYNALYDVAARANIGSQLISMYSYPRLCRDQSSVPRFLSVGLAIALATAGVAWALVPVSDSIVALYLGERMASGGAYLPLFAMVTSLYSLAFFSQAAFRSLGLFSIVATHFSVSAAAGLVAMGTLFHFYGIQGLLFSLLVLKSPGLIGYCTLRRRTKPGTLFDGLLCTYVGVLVLFSAYWWL